MTIEKETKFKNALGYASLMLLAAWQAARIEGSEKTPEILAEIEKRINSGQANLSINIQQIGGIVHLTAAVLEPTFSAAFDNPILVTSGPLVLSREQLELVAAVSPGEMH